MKIAMIGTGYVGLVSGVCFSDFGHEVVCVDKDPRKITLLEKGEVPIYEPGLDALMARNVEAGRLSFTGDLKTAVAGADAVFIAVGTPTRRGDGHADLTYVYAAAEEIAGALTGYAVIVTKSTVPVGTNHRVRDIIRETVPGAEFDVASNPEFLREGAAIDDFMRPDRVVVGVESDRAAAVMQDIYRPLFLRDFPGGDHRHRLGRDDQVRRQRLPRDQDHLHQRDRDALREDRRRHQAGVEGHRPRRPDRQQVPACRPRLWRLVLSQGHQRARADRPGPRGADAHRRDGDRGQRRGEAADDRQDPRPLRRLGERQDASRSSASPSSPIPTTCATRRR